MKNSFRNKILNIPSPLTNNSREGSESVNGSGDGSKSGSDKSTLYKKNARIARVSADNDFQELPHSGWQRSNKNVAISVSPVTQKQREPIHTANKLNESVPFRSPTRPNTFLNSTLQQLDERDNAILKSDEFVFDNTGSEQKYKKHVTFDESRSEMPLRNGVDFKNTLQSNTNSQPPSFPEKVIKYFARLPTSTLLYNFIAGRPKTFRDAATQHYEDQMTSDLVHYGSQDPHNSKRRAHSLPNPNDNIDAAMKSLPEHSIINEFRFIDSKDLTKFTSDYGRNFEEITLDITDNESHSVNSTDERIQEDPSHAILNCVSQENSVHTSQSLQDDPDLFINFENEIHLYERIGGGASGSVYRCSKSLKIHFQNHFTNFCLLF